MIDNILDSSEVEARNINTENISKLELSTTFDVLPLLNNAENKLKKRSTFSLLSNKTLNCRWCYYVTNFTRVQSKSSSKNKK